MSMTGSFALSLLCLLLPSTEAVEITAEPVHHQVLANEQVRAFKVEVAPHASTLLHRHGHDYLFVALGASHISNEVLGKPPVELELTDGETRFTAGNFAHVARNLADQPFRNVTIELMQDEKLRDATPPWKPGDGDRELPGVRIHGLFVRDGARVSSVEIQPGATVPRHHHDGPHLVVAVSDLELSSDVEGRGPVSSQIRSGEVKWIPGGFTHTLANIGKAPARLVTVEFPAH